MNLRAPQRRWIPETALNNGNCAFNAVILALSERDILDTIEANLGNPNERLSDFIALAATALHVTPNWSSVKAELIRLKQEDSTDLQLKLAPVLRHLSMNLIAKKADTNYIEGRKQALFADFRNYILKWLFKMRIAKDDIYDLAFIRKQYDVLLSEFEFDDLDRYKALRRRHGPREEKEFSALDTAFEHVVEEIQRSLGTWWNDEGFTQFQEIMARDAVWVGDLELVPLFDYFGVDFQIKSRRFGDNPVEIHSARGAIAPADSKLSETCVQEMIGRKMVEGTNKSVAEIIHANVALKWQRMSEAQLNQSLAAVPDIELVRTALNALPAKFSRVSPEICANGALIAQLQKRGVITQRNLRWVFANDYTQSTQRDAALRRIDACPQAAAILLLWRASYRQAPTITLENEHASHWNPVKLYTAAPSAPSQRKRKEVGGGASKGGLFGTDKIEREEQDVQSKRLKQQASTEKKERKDSAPRHV